MLKKLCIHVLEVISEGSTQDSVIGQRLNIVDLFEKDLHDLSFEEHKCIKSIAQDTPADFFQICDLYGNDVVSQLINKRLVIRRASKLTLYWDIFRDYVLYQTIPTIILDYVPQYPFGVIARTVQSLLDNGGEMTSEELADKMGYELSTIDNMIIDFLMFGLAKRSNSIITLNILSEVEIIESLQSFFKNHALFIELQKQTNPIITYDNFVEIFENVYKDSVINSKTKTTYASKMFNWPISLQLIIATDGEYMLSQPKVNGTLLSGYIQNNRRSRYSSGQHDLFWGQASPDKLIEAFNKVSSGENNITILKKQGLRNAVELLTITKGCRRNGDTLILQKTLDEIFEYANQSPTIVLIKKKLVEKSDLNAQEAGEVLNTAFNRKWKESSKKRYGSSVIRWSKYMMENFEK